MWKDLNPPEPLEIRFGTCFLHIWSIGVFHFQHELQLEILKAICNMQYGRLYSQYELDLHRHEQLLCNVTNVVFWKLEERFNKAKNMMIIYQYT